MFDMDRIAEAINHEKPLLRHFDVTIRTKGVTPEFHEHGYWPEVRILRKLMRCFMGMVARAPSLTTLQARIAVVPGGFIIDLHLMFGEEAVSVEEFGRTFQSLLQNVNRQVRSHLERREKERPAKAVPTNILIVDDNPISTKLLGMCFQQLGCRTCTVSSGEDAIGELAAKTYDLLVLDWEMPGMDGRQVLESAQRTLPKVRKLQVVTYSGYSPEQMNIPNCESLVVRDHIAKASPFPELKQTTARIIHELRGKGELKS